MARQFDKLAFVASPTPEAKDAAAALGARYAHAPPEQADVVVALGGDGFMLQSLHRFMGTGKPIYGMNKGSVGFLMNDFREDSLVERLPGRPRSTLPPPAVGGGGAAA